MIQNMKKILEEARRKGYAVGAFNVYNIETIKAVLNAGARCRSPIILQVSFSAIRYASLRIIVETIKIGAIGLNIPVVIHLDHGKDLGLIEECLNAGFTSVMYDGSREDFYENIKNTRKVVEMAGKFNASAEGEVGIIGGREDYIKGNVEYTNPSRALEFAEKTGVDALAVSIGTSHGILKQESGRLRINLLKEIRKEVKVPLVLHGASLIRKRDVQKAESYGAKIKEFKGIKPREIKAAIKEGVAKINIDSDLRLVFSGAMREFYSKNPENINPRDALSYAERSVEKSVEEHIKLFGSYGKA